MSKLESTTGNYDKEDIKQMNDKLKPYQERTHDFTQDNFVSTCYNIEKKIFELETLSKELKDYEAKLDSEISDMTNKIFNLFDQNYKEFNPKLIEKYKRLKQNIREQKDESANLNKQIDFLKQEMESMKDKISKLSSRVGLLEETTGVKLFFNRSARVLPA